MNDSQVVHVSYGGDELSSKDLRVAFLQFPITLSFNKITKIPTTHQFRHQIIYVTKLKGDNNEYLVFDSRQLHIFII